MPTVFADILARAVDHTPGAIGGAFAADDGETVDAVSSLGDTELALLTAHYGVLFALVQSALHTFHFGEAEQLFACHDRVDVLVQAVGDGYYALLALEHPASLAVAMRELEGAVRQLRAEMA